MYRKEGTTVHVDCRVLSLNAGVMTPILDELNRGYRREMLISRANAAS